MKLLFFSPYFYPYTSGVTTLPYKILIHLAKTHQVTVLTFAFKPSLPQTETHEHLTIIRMPYLFKISKGFISPQSLVYFYRHARSHDKIITNLPNVEGVPLILISKLFQKPIISLFLCRVFLTGTFKNKVLSSVLQIAESIQLQLSTKIITLTQDYFKSLGLDSRHQAKTIYTIPLIDQPFTPEIIKGLHRTKDSISIGFAGRIAQEKGIEYLIKAVQVVALNHPNIDLVFAGPEGKNVAGEYPYYRRIKELLAQSGISYRFLGYLTTEQLTYFYRQLEILVLPSINSTEAFGMVQAESMLADTPVIATDLPGVRIPVKQTRMGLIVPPGNASALATAIQDIIHHRTKYVNPATRQKVKTFFDNQQNLRTYVQAITSN